MDVYTYIYIYLLIYTYVYTSTYINMYMYINIYNIYTWTYISTYIYIHTYVYIYTYIYIVYICVHICIYSPHNVELLFLALGPDSYLATYIYECIYMYTPMCRCIHTRQRELEFVVIRTWLISSCVLWLISSCVHQTTWTWVCSHQNMINI